MRVISNLNGIFILQSLVNLDLNNKIEVVGYSVIPEIIAKGLVILPPKKQKFWRWSNDHGFFLCKIFIIK